MCFSASASFAAAAVLAPVAAVTLTTALRGDRRYLGFAVFPLFFGIQQALEGGLWLSIGREDPQLMHWYAIGFLFFAYFLWPFWVPLSTSIVEPDRGRRRKFIVASVLGGLLGLSLFVPLLFLAEPLPIQIVKQSINYNSPLVWDGVVPKAVIRVVYAVIVCVPMLLSSVRPVRIFGALITISVIGGFLFAHYAFTSVWCFFAALLSCYVVFIVREASTATSGSRSAAM